MKKRIVSFLMALVMAVSLLPVSAFAALPWTIDIDVKGLFEDESKKIGTFDFNNEGEILNFDLYYFHVSGDFDTLQNNDNNWVL